MSRVYDIEYAGHLIHYSFQNSETKRYFGRFLRRSDAISCEILASKEDIDHMKPFFLEDSRESYVEYKLLICLTARELLKYDCCIFHAVSFLWRDRAWLITAPSGTGKTTQYLNWQRLFPGEIEMICGDMPVLERREDGSVWAHPTTWNGKENIGNRICAPVGGIVLLEQGCDNTITSLPSGEAIIPFFHQFAAILETEEQIRALARLMDRMLRNIPCYCFVNRGDDASTALLRETLAPLAEGGNHDKL